VDRRPFVLILVLTTALVAACSGTGTTPAPATPTPATGAAAAVQLAQTLPAQVGSVALDRQPLTAAQIADLADYKDIVGGLANLGKQPEDLVAATATDPTGASDLRIMAFQIVGVGQGVLSQFTFAWQNSLSGATVTQTNIGRPVTMVSQQGMAPIYYYGTADKVYMVQTADQALAQQALTALPS
jgi:hypothetical protein